MPVALASVDEMLHRLEQHPAVTGLISYGSDHRGDGYTVGDFDLFVVTGDWQPAAESLHFRVGDVPVDLNLLTLDALQNLEAVFDFPQLPLAEGRVLYDPTGEVSSALETLTRRLETERPTFPSDPTVAFLRHGHRHLLDKLRGRLETEPLLAHFLLSVNPYWLMENYFRVRQLPFKGERWALAYWREHDNDTYATFEALYQAPDLGAQFALTEQLTERVLAPVGGAWQPDEVLAFGEGSHGRPLAARAAETYRDLFGRR